MMDTGLRNKTVLVTGGSGGIGQSIVHAMIAEGANVIVHYHSGNERAEKLVESLPDPSSIAIAADVAEELDVQQLFDQSDKAFGAVDVLIANAGEWPAKDIPIHEMTLERWNATFSVNATGVFLCVREFLSRCVARNFADPSIVVTGSTAGRCGEAGHADYAAAKSSFMYGLVQSLKNEITRIAANGRVMAGR